MKRREFMTLIAGAAVSAAFTTPAARAAKAVTAKPDAFSTAKGLPICR